MRILAAVLIAMFTSAPEAFAQTPALPRGFIAVNVVRASNDASERMRLGQDARPWIYSGGVSVRVAPRVALGGEAIDFGVATGETRGNSFRSSGEQRERAVAGLLRVTATGAGKFALEAVGGAGILFQQHVATEASCFGQCATVLTEEYEHRAPLLIAGADVPIRLARNFSVAAIGRYYVMRRGDNTPEDPRQPIRWQFEHESSSRVAIGAAARVTW